MKIDVALQILDDNYNTDNDSFLDFTHERNQFNETAYWQFYNAIRCVTNENVQSDLDRILTFKIIKSYEWFLLQIGFHFDENDLSKIMNLPKNYMEYSLRLREVVDAYIRGQKVTDEDEKYLNSDLQNPY